MRRAAFYVCFNGRERERENLILYSVIQILKLKDFDSVQNKMMDYYEKPKKKKKSDQIKAKPARKYLNAFRYFNCLYFTSIFYCLKNKASK